MGTFKRGREEGGKFTCHGILTLWDEFGGTLTVRVLHAEANRYNHVIPETSTRVQEVGESHGGRSNGRQTELPWDDKSFHTDKWQRNAASPPLNASSTDAQEEECGLDESDETTGSLSWDSSTPTRNSRLAQSDHSNPRAQESRFKEVQPSSPHSFRLRAGRHERRGRHLTDYIGNEYVIERIVGKAHFAPGQSNTDGDQAVLAAGSS